MRRWTAFATAVLLVGLSACDGDPKAAPAVGATVPTAPAQTTTTNPFAVPATIDAAYVDRVLAGLDAAVGDVVRMVVATKTIPREATERLRSIYGTDVIFDLAIDSVSRDIAQGLRGYRLEPGNRVTVVSELITSRSSCVFAKVARDYTAVATVTNSNLTTQWVGIKTLDRNRDPSGYNVVGWSIIYDGTERDFGPPKESPCVAFP